MVRVVNKRPITIHEAREILEKVAGGGLEAQADSVLKRVLDYLNKFAKIDGDKARKLVDELVEKTGLTEEEAVEVVNILPGSVEELRTLTIGWRKLLTTEQLQGILDLIKSYTQSS